MASAPPPSKEQIELLQKLYYTDSFTFGRDKLYQYIRTNHKDVKISRRQVMDWISKQEIAQMHKPDKEARDLKSTILKGPHQTLAIDLVDMQNFEFNGYKYLLNGVDMFSRKLYSIPLKNKEEKTTVDGLKKLSNRSQI